MSTSPPSVPESPPEPDLELPEDSTASVRYAIRSPQSQSERRALGIVALGALALLAWIMLPVAVGMLLGALTGFTLEPLYARILKRTRRPAAAALACLALAFGAFVIVVGGLASLLVTRGTVLAQQLIASSEPGGPARAIASKWIVRLGLGAQTDGLAKKLRDAAGEVAAGLASLAAQIAGRAFGVLLLMFFLMMTLYFMLRHWHRIETLVIECLPLHPRHSKELFEEFRLVGRATLLGTIGTGVAQGVLAGIGYALCGAPEPAFFGALTVIASLFPGVGTLLIWVPIGAYLIATGHPVAGALELAYGALIVVGASDYGIRPRLVGAGGHLPTLLTFAGLFGGVEVFGLVGLIVGPLCTALAVALLRIYMREERAFRARPG